VLHYLIGPPPAPKLPVAVSAPMPPVDPRPSTAPLFEVYPEAHHPARRAAPPPAAPPVRPRIAIIIDDLGYDPAIADQFIGLGAPVTLSILPNSPFAREIAESAHRNGIETMLHLPMEPVEYPAVDPGPGALLTAMSADDLIAQLNRNIDQIPHAVGVNNHMGSKMTASSSQIYQVFSVLKQRGLFFIDSRTTSRSVCQASARLFKLRFAQRDVFLDNRLEPAVIRFQLDQLVEAATTHGEAIGIAHPHEMTLQVLKGTLGELVLQVQLVAASELVGVAG
jgi:polysaccharide deacetylase 2 family uncharacterized protein YibQ